MKWAFIRRWGFSVLPALVVGLAAPSVFAQGAPVPAANGGGFDTHLFRPAFDSRGLVSVNGVDVVGDGRFSLGLVLDYGNGILRVRDVGQKSMTLVNHSFTGTFNFNYGIANRAIVGVSAPVVLLSGDEQFRGGPTPAPAVVGWGPQSFSTQAFSNVAFHGKVKIFGASGPGIGVALAAQVGLPVSDVAKSAGGEPGLWYWPMLVLEKRFGASDQLKIAANAGYRGHAPSPSTTTLPLAEGQFKDGSRITYGIGASLRILEPLDAIVETYGTFLLSDSAAAVRPSNEAIAGIKLFVDDASFLVISGGPRITGGFEAADLRGVVGFIFEPPSGDTDGDGIRDDVDRCPNVAGVRANQGCPLDTDGDGIPDVEDACPLVKGPRTNDPKTNGCPPIRERAPEPEVPLDRDHDGVPDAEDACPDIPGPRHPDPKRNGCPDIFIGPDVIVVMEKILFKTASAEILPESNEILDKLAKVLNAHPELTLIEVEGHADERGGEQYNLSLTQARVESVVRALVARDVERSRLRAKGYGFYCPLEEGHDEAAWQTNRRVEFRIVKTTRGPTDSPLGCARAAAHGVRSAPVP